MAFIYNPPQKDHFICDKGIVGWGKKLNQVNVKVIFQESLRSWAPGFFGGWGIFLLVVGAGTAFKFTFIFIFLHLSNKIY